MKRRALTPLLVGLGASVWAFSALIGRSSPVEGHLTWASIQKRAEFAQPLCPADKISYSITLTSQSDLHLGSQAQAAAIRDPIPANTAYLPGSVSGGAAYNAGANRIEWDGTLRPEESVSIGFAVTVNGGVVSGMSIVNEATGTLAEFQVPAQSEVPVSCATATSTSTPTPTPTLTPDPWTTDSDADGCNDAEELGPNPTRGGRRDPASFWDFFDTPSPNPLMGGPQRDRSVSIDDIVRVVARFGTTGDPTVDPRSKPPKAGYHPAYDRGGPIAGGDRWDLRPANGSIDVGDIVAVVAQFGHFCDGPASAILATFDVVGERFIAHVLNPATIAQILALERGESTATIPIGRLRAGTGYNTGWSWHTDPWEISMAEITIELCDGRPSHVEADLDYWLNTVGSYCPWSARLVEVRYLP